MSVPSHSGLFKLIKDEHGMEVLKSVRHYVNTASKISRTRQHITLQHFSTCHIIYCHHYPFKCMGAFLCHHSLTKVAVCYRNVGKQLSTLTCVNESLVMSAPSHSCLFKLESCLFAGKETFFSIVCRCTFSSFELTLEPLHCCS